MPTEDSATNKAVVLARKALSMGLRVRSMARGASMFPLIWPREMVVVRPVPADERPPIGALLVMDRGGDQSFVLHRLIGYEADGSVVTRGDSVLSPDPVWRREVLIGQVISVEGRFSRKVRSVADDGGCWGWYVMRLAPVSYWINHLLAHLGMAVWHLLKFFRGGADA